MVGVVVGARGWPASVACGAAIDRAKLPAVVASFTVYLMHQHDIAGFGPAKCLATQWRKSR